MPTNKELLYKLILNLNEERASKLMNCIKNDLCPFDIDIDIELNKECDGRCSDCWNIHVFSQIIEETT